MNDDFFTTGNGEQPQDDENRNVDEGSEQSDFSENTNDESFGNDSPVNEQNDIFGTQNQSYTPIFGNQNQQNNDYQYGNSREQYQNGNYQYGGQQFNGYQPNGGSQFGFSNDLNGSNMPPKPPKKKNKGMIVFICLISVIVVLAVALMGVIFARNSDKSGGGKKPDSIISNEDATGDSGNDRKDTDNVDGITANPGSLSAGEAAEVAKAAKQYNVGILIYKNDSLYTEGSGVVVKEDNDKKYTYIVTCAHVVNHNNCAISVLMEDGTEYPAELVGLDTRTDLAVVRIEASGLTAAEFASSEGLIVGQTVYAVGNPGGSEFFGSVTNGIISAIGRPVSSSTGYEMECIQHTAAINPGNSGGALVNGEGKVIGINSMKIASTEYEGMGFSVPSNVVTEVFNSIIENGYVAGRAKLGITYTTPSGFSQTYAMYVQMKGLPSGTIVVASVSEDSDLASKGVKKGDMITKVNGKEMTDSGMLSSMIEDMSVGDTLTLTIVSVNTDNWSQTEQNVTVKLVEDKGNSTVQSSEETTTNNQFNPFGGSSGGSAEDWYDYFKKNFGY